MAGEEGKRERCERGHIRFFGQEGVPCKDCEYTDNMNAHNRREDDRLALLQTDKSAYLKELGDVAEHRKLSRDQYDKMLELVDEQNRSFIRIAGSLEKLSDLLIKEAKKNG